MQGYFGSNEVFKMILTVIFSIITCLMMIVGVLFIPKIKIFKFKTDSYWLFTLIGAIIVVIVSGVDLTVFINSLTADTSINPIKILVLFISMTMLSLFLDELGFFRYLANVTLKNSKASQLRLFFYLYVTVSVLTVFTSNDVIILSFTPFICYFAKHAKINPIPYLCAEFIAANTWSMALVVGNPTNIYLATAYGINFLDYAKVMIVPTIFAGITAFAVLFSTNKNKLNSPIFGVHEDVVIEDKFSLIVGIVHLAVCTVMLAVSSYIGLEMWLVSLLAVLSLFIWVFVIGLVKKIPPRHVFTCVKRAPWQLIPFVLSMFVMIIALENKGVTGLINGFLGQDYIVYKYGFASFISANVINNIPMSALFCSVISPLSGIAQSEAVFASIVGSNLGAFFTPIGALAGIMWSSILNDQHLSFKYLDFLKMGVIVAIPTLIVTLLSLNIFII